MSLRDGLVAEYLFAGDARDTSGRQRHATVRGATLTADRFGRADSAYQFDGVDDEIVAPAPDLSPHGMTVSAWARFDERSLGGWTSCIVAQDNGDDHDQSRRVFQLSVHHRHVVWHRMVGARDPVDRRRLRFGEWYHFVGVFDGKTHRLYADGKLADQVEHAFWTSAEQPLHIGRKGTSEPHFFFKGAIDDVRIYTRAIDDGEVRALFGEGGFTKPAFSPRRDRDPISGRWGQCGVTFLDLSFDGARAVTGEVMNGRPHRMVPIVSGWYDRTSGVLHLDGVAEQEKTGERCPFYIDGLLDGHHLTVSASFGGWTDNLHFTKDGARWPWRYAFAKSLSRGIERVLGLRRHADE